MLNIGISVLGCLFAVWIGLLCGRSLFMYSNGMIQWSGGMIPYALMIINVIGAFIIGLIACLILEKIELPLEYRAAIMVILVGAYLTLSGLYLILFLIENGYTFSTHTQLMVSIFFANGLSCLLMIWLSLLITKQL
jgi:CrcB protein